MRLIVEPDTRGDLRDGFPVEEAASRGVDPPRHDVTVRCDAKRAGEAPNEMRR